VGRLGPFAGTRTQEIREPVGSSQNRQPADVVGGWAGEPRGMEIRISLDRVEPPAGRLRLVPGPEPAPGPAEGEAIPFTGWLGLLRALSEVVGPADGEHLDRG
jgi:hypothetical protein